MSTSEVQSRKFQKKHSRNFLIVLTGFLPKFSQKTFCYCNHFPTKTHVFFIGLRLRLYVGQSNIFYFRPINLGIVLLTILQFLETFHEYVQILATVHGVRAFDDRFVAIGAD